MTEVAGETGDALDERRLRSLIDVGRALVSNLDLELVLGRVLEVARELTGARYAAVGILDDRRESLERFITLGVDEQTRAEIGDLPRGRGVLGVLISDPQPLRLDDVGRHPRSFGFPPGHPPMKSFLGVPILIRGEAFGNLYLTEKEGGAFTLADEQSAVILADWAAIAIDNARLYKTVWDRREELERAVGRLEATTEIARALGGETELGRVLELIVKRGRALVDARALVIVLARDGELEVAAAAGEADSGAIGLRVPMESPLWSGVFRSGRPERRNDPSTGLRVEPSELGLNALSALMVPLVFRSKNLGVLAAFDRVVAGPQFSDEDETLLRSFAASAATAVRTAQSVEEERLRQSIEASEQERRRWARELHDETLQGLGGLRVLLSSAVQRGGPALEQAAREAIDQTAEQIERLRGLIAELRPAALDELGLAPAIRGLAERTSAVQALPVDVEIDLDMPDGSAGRLTPELETTIYRLVQEALHNIGKHARAEHASVRLSHQDGKARIEVRDDGVGFEPARAGEGFGLTGMRERVALLGGTLEVHSSPGEGTAIRIVLPALPPS